MSVQSTQAGFQYWSLTTDPFLYANQIVIDATLRINSSSYITTPATRAGYYLGVMDNSSLPVWTSITDTGVYFHYEGEVTSSFVPLNLNDGQFHDFRMVADSTGFDLFIDGVQYIDEPFKTGNSALPNFLSFGDQSNSGQSNVDLLFYQATISEVPIPSAFFLFAAGLFSFGMVGFRRKLHEYRMC